VYGYGHVACPDVQTHRLAGKADGYRGVYGWPHTRIAECIRGDQIDILLVVGGHVGDNGLQVCIHQAAPIQVDFQGIGTTGLEQVHYRLTDDQIDPPDSLRFYVEESLYLPGGLPCLRPPESSPWVSPLPASHNGYVTFGAFNSHVKITEPVLDAWATLLRAVPGSRLLLKFHSGSDPTLRRLCLDGLGRRGVTEDRVEIWGRMAYMEYMDLYSRVDVALDTHPFNGCITTLEGLWMGVPLVTLTGDTFVSRMGRSILCRVGLEALSCTTVPEYVAKARALASQTDALAAIRSSLRERLLASPLCSPRRIGAELESAFRTMWDRWCRTQGRAQHSP
jgi:predicted O-linked N-acetylglucosamine transferase (SPINDLY family)